MNPKLLKEHCRLGESSEALSHLAMTEKKHHRPRLLPNPKIRPTIDDSADSESIPAQSENSSNGKTVGTISIYGCRSPKLPVDNGMYTHLFMNDKTNGELTETTRHFEGSANHSDPLSFASDLPSLVKLLNDQELLYSRRVLAVFSKLGDPPTDSVNLVSFSFDICSFNRMRLQAVEIPAESTSAGARTATMPDVALHVRNAFLDFIAPYLEAAEALCRAEVFIGPAADKIEIVLLRQTDPFVPCHIGGIVSPTSSGAFFLENRA